MSEWGRLGGKEGGKEGGREGGREGTKKVCFLFNNSPNKDTSVAHSWVPTTRVHSFYSKRQHTILWTTFHEICIML